MQYLAKYGKFQPILSHSAHSALILLNEKVKNKILFAARWHQSTDFTRVVCWKQSIFYCWPNSSRVGFLPCFVWDCFCMAPFDLRYDNLHMHCARHEVVWEPPFLNLVSFYVSFSWNRLQLEYPVQTAAILSLCGVKSIVMNHWNTMLNSNNEKLHHVFNGKLSFVIFILSFVIQWSSWVKSCFSI